MYPETLENTGKQGDRFPKQVPVYLPPYHSVTLKVDYIIPV